MSREEFEFIGLTPEKHKAWLDKVNKESGRYLYTNSRGHQHWRRNPNHPRNPKA